MGTVALSSASRIDTAEALGAAGVGWWELASTTKAAVLEPDFVYQGTRSISEKVGTTEFGIGYQHGSDMNFSSPVGTLVAKCIATNFGVLNNTGATGMIIRFGSSTTAYWSYYVSGGNDYPPTGGWLIIPIDPNEVAWRNATTGAPTLTTIRRFDLACTFSATSKGENVAADALDRIDTGGGLIVTGSSSLFQDFVDFDEETTTNRYGFVITKSGAIFAVGRLIIGSATATTFSDSNITVIWPSGLYGTAFAGLSIDLQNASTSVSMANCVFAGRGSAGLIRWFDAALDVSSANDRVTITSHGYITGDYVLYSDNGGAQTMGLTDVTNYWVNSFSVNEISFHTTRANALAATSPVNLTAATAPGENHKLTKSPDTRPVLAVTSTSGSAVLTGCTFNSFNTLTLTSTVDLTSCIMLSCTQLTLAGGDLLDCVIESAVLDEGVAVVTATSLADITSCTFTASTRGHAIELTSATGSPFTWNSFHTGYGSTYATFLTSQAFTSEILTTVAAHSFTTGDPVFYNKGGGTAAIGLTDLAKYYVNVLSTTTLSLHLTKSAAVGNTSRINLTTAGAETHQLGHSRAVLYNNTGAAIVINVTAGTDPPTIRNGSGASTTVNASVPIEIAGTTEGAAIKIIASESVGSVTAGDVILETLADSLGEASVGFNYEGDINVVVRVRQQGLPNAAIAADSGVFTDETTAANSSTATDMNLVPATTPAINDAYYFGHNEQFSRIKLEISQIFTGTTLTLAWEYYNGSTWTALSGVSDGCSSTNGFDVLGENIVSWTIPVDWTDITVNSQGPMKMVRARVTAVTSMTQQPKARRCKLDVTRYLPFSQNRIIEATGLTVFVTWVEDVIATF